MRKIGIATLTLVAVATAACGESPVAASAAGAEASLTEVWVGTGAYEAGNPGLLGSGHYETVSSGFGGSGTAAVPGDDEMMITVQMEGNPGLLGSGH